MEVDPGVIICGYKGDPVVDDPNSTIKRPAWAKDGTMMVFRKLEQDVLGFDDYLATNGKRWREFSLNGAKDNLTDEEGAELWGARMIGRWKSVSVRTSSLSVDTPNQISSRVLLCSSVRCATILY